MNEQAVNLQNCNKEETWGEVLLFLSFYFFPPDTKLAKLKTSLCWVCVLPIRSHTAKRIQIVKKETGPSLEGH